MMGRKTPERGSRVKVNNKSGGSRLEGSGLVAGAKCILSIGLVCIIGTLS